MQTSVLIFAVVVSLCGGSSDGAVVEERRNLPRVTEVVDAVAADADIAGHANRASSLKWKATEFWADSGNGPECRSVACDASVDRHPPDQKLVQYCVSGSPPSCVFYSTQEITGEMPKSCEDPSVSITPSSRGVIVIPTSRIGRPVADGRFTELIKYSWDFTLDYYVEYEADCDIIYALGNLVPAKEACGEVDRLHPLHFTDLGTIPWRWTFAQFSAGYTAVLDLLTNQDSSLDMLITAARHPFETCGGLYSSSTFAATVTAIHSKK